MSERKVLHRVKMNQIDSVLYEDQVRVEWQPEVKSVRVTLNMPERLNTMPMAWLEWMKDFIINEVDQNDDVKSFVLAAEGEHFGGGINANELGFYIDYGTGKTEADKKRPTQRARMVADRELSYGPMSLEQTLHRCQKVSILEVKGKCFGIHMELAMIADIVVAADNSMFTHPAYRYLGGFANVLVILENLGIKKTKEMILTAKPLTAEELCSNSVVTKVVPLEDLRKTTDEYCQAISLLPLDGITVGKALMEQALETRGYGYSFVQSWTGHGWVTNLSFEDDEWIFLKERRDKGLSKAMYERDKMAPRDWRLGRARYEED